MKDRRVELEKLLASRIDFCVDDMQFLVIMVAVLHRIDVQSYALAVLRRPYDLYESRAAFIDLWGIVT